MKLITVFMIFAFVVGHAKERPFLLSSEGTVQRGQAPLTKQRAFQFLPLLKIQPKLAYRVLQLLEDELQKVGTVIKQPVFTSEGIDMEAFSHPVLQFSVEQLVDQEGHILPVVRASLAISSAVDVYREQTSVCLDTNCWSVYLKKPNDLQSVGTKALPDLLQQFLAEFRRDRAADDRPVFYICYDETWWPRAEN